MCDCTGFIWARDRQWRKADWHAQKAKEAGLADADEWHRHEAERLRILDAEDEREDERGRRYAGEQVHHSDLAFSGIVAGVMIKYEGDIVGLAVDLVEAKVKAFNLAVGGLWPLTLHHFTARLETVDEKGYEG